MSRDAHIYKMSFSYAPADAPENWKIACYPGLSIEECMEELEKIKKLWHIVQAGILCPGGHAHGIRQSQPQRIEQKKRGRAEHMGQEISNPDSQYGDNAGYGASQARFEKPKKIQRLPERCAQSGLGGMADGSPDWYVRPWPDEPEDVPRVAEGVPNRTARIKAIGNAWVPTQAAEAWRVLK